MTLDGTEEVEQAPPAPSEPAEASETGFDARRSGQDERADAMALQPPPTPLPPWLQAAVADVASMTGKQGSDGDAGAPSPPDAPDAPDDIAPPPPSEPPTSDETSTDSVLSDGSLATASSSASTGAPLSHESSVFPLPSSADTSAEKEDGEEGETRPELPRHTPLTTTIVASDGTLLLELCGVYPPTALRVLARQRAALPQNGYGGKLYGVYLFDRNQVGVGPYVLDLTGEAAATAVYVASRRMASPPNMVSSRRVFLANRLYRNR